jgi:glycosyltransferase A (GT-A) superfamily protein (DUF2064 family)
MHRVGAVVPAWNEAAAIGEVVSGLRRAGACCVFVVDPGSTDGTREVAARAGAGVVVEPRRGYGRACLSGAAAAVPGHELVAFLDGDGSCDPAELAALTAAAGPGADLVLGRRDQVEAGAMPWHARLGNRLVAATLRARTGRPVHDLSPFKLVCADALAALRLDDDGFGWTVQLIGRALSHPAIQVIEAPVAFRARAGGRSKISGRLGPSLRAARTMMGQALEATRPRGLLVLMAKAPRPGHSKTRLAQDLGPPTAASFWAACLRDAGARIRQSAAAADLDVAAMTPSAEDARQVRRLTGLPALVQRSPGLGHALLEVSELPAPFTVAVSGDAPMLPIGRLLDAVAALRRAPAVLGPDEDGGYYLVGLRRGFPLQRRRAAYLEAQLGSGSVLEHTRTALGDPVLVAPCPDVDSTAALQRLAEELDENPSAAPNVAAWLREHPVSPGGERWRKSSS